MRHRNDLNVTGDEIERCGAEFIDSEEFLRLSSM